jgi:hypothetical protein
VKLGMLVTSTPGRDRTGTAGSLPSGVLRRKCSVPAVAVDVHNRPASPDSLAWSWTFLWEQDDTRGSHCWSLRPDLVPGAADLRLAGDQQNMLGVSNRLHARAMRKA